MSDKNFNAFAPVDAEMWRAESLEDLHDETDGGLQVGMTIQRGVSLPPEMGDLCSADDVISTMAERAYDFAGEAGDLFDVTKEAEAALDAVLKEWYAAHVNVTFYKIVDTEDYIITQEDVDSLRTKDQA